MTGPEWLLLGFVLGVLTTTAMSGYYQHQTRRELERRADQIRREMR